MPVDRLRTNQAGGAFGNQRGGREGSTAAWLPVISMTISKVITACITLGQQAAVLRMATSPAAASGGPLPGIVFFPYWLAATQGTSVGRDHVIGSAEGHQCAGGTEESIRKLTYY